MLDMFCTFHIVQILSTIKSIVDIKKYNVISVYAKIICYNDISWNQNKSSISEIFMQQGFPDSLITLKLWIQRDEQRLSNGSLVA